MLQQRTEEKIMRNSLFKPVIAGCNTCCCCWRGIKKIENKRIVSVLLWTIRADTGRQEGTRGDYDKPRVFNNFDIDVHFIKRSPPHYAEKVKLG